MFSFRLMKPLLGLLLWWLPVAGVWAQTVEQVKQGNAYYWGEGVGKTMSQADEGALSMLVNRISTQVESAFRQITKQDSKDGKINFEQNVEISVKTYSNATLKNVEVLSWGEEPEVHVFRFVKRAEIDKIFAERETKIKEFVAIARKAEANYQIADALRYYYWALMLLQSHPDVTSMLMEIDGKRERLDIFLPIQIKAVFDHLQFAVTGKQPEENLTQYLLQITYKQQPVSNCEYLFFNGRNWSNPVGAKDGKGIVEMAGDTALHKDIRVKIEYVFENEWEIDKDVKDVMHKIEPVIFKNSYLTVPLTEIKKPAQAVAAVPDVPVPASLQAVDGAPYLSLLERVEQAIRTKQYASVRDCFTDEGYDMFTRLVQYGRGVIVAKPVYSFLSFEDGILARALPMRFSFSNNRRAFVEDVVFNISQDEGKIRSLAFALPNKVCGDILKYEEWSEYSRMAVIHFIETYKTAYALKRLDYIESIFSDNALIIVGRIVKEATMENRFAADKVKRTQYDKGKYIENLSKAFRNNEYVNLKFTDIDVKKAGVGDELYGIQLKQDYFSTGYGDTGYLFLAVDLNKTEEPVIHIRTWQPEKDPDFGLYDITHF
jgi:hypothetical protein